jgi:hypothetical protein
MATVTSRRAKLSPAVLKQRRALADQRLALEIKLTPQYAEIARLDAALKKAATDGGEPFKEDFGARGSVGASGAVAAESKGEQPVLQTEAWLAMKEIDRRRLIKSGLIKLEQQFGKASNGRVTVKVL